MSSNTLLVLATKARQGARGIWPALAIIVSGQLLAWSQDASVEAKDSSSTNSTIEARGSLSLRWENDAFAGTDRDYSNGISLSLLLRGRGLLGGFWDLFSKGDRECFQGYEAGQVMVTPADTSLAIPDPNDRPYAGMLHVDIATAMRQANQFHGFKIVTGVVGPYSLAEETQN